MKALLRYLFPIAMVGCVGCQQPVSPQVQQGISAGVSLVVCILNHITESPPQILTDCGPGAVSGVISTIDAAHRANDVASLIALSGARTPEEMGMVSDAHNAAMIRADAGAP